MTEAVKSLVQTMNSDGWRIRRRWMSLILAWMIGCVTYLLFQGQDNALHQNIAMTMIGCITAIMGSYVFGAAWEDSSKYRFAQDALYNPQQYSPSIDLRRREIDSGEE